MTKIGLALWVVALSLSFVLRASAQETVSPVAHPNTAAPAASSAPVALAPRGDSTVSATSTELTAKVPKLELSDPAAASDKEPAPQLSPGRQSGGGGGESSQAVSGGATSQKNGALLDIAGLPLARLIERDHIFSGLGTFKQLLPKYGIASYIHGTSLIGLVGQTAPEPELLNDHPGENSPRFGAEFNLFIGAELLNRVFVEAQIVFDANASEFTSDYTQIDIRVYRDFLFIRGGKFWTPVGGINVYPDPLYLFPTPDLPMFMGNVLPGEWGELGVQLYGRCNFSEGRGLSYAFYVVNGLEQRVVNPGDPVSGGAMRNMLNNYLDQSDPDKAVGAQLVLEPISGLTLGVSGYEGVYTITGQHRLYIADAHMGLKLGKFTLRGEVATTFEETAAAGTLLKIGGYAFASYRFKYLEPLVMVDGIRLDGSHELDRIAATVGLIAYPFPQKVPTVSVRTTYSPRWKTEPAEFATHHFALDARVAF